VFAYANTALQKVDVSLADYTVPNVTGKLSLMLSKSGLEFDGHGRFENVISTLTWIT
jgi:hypothetical protein